jgi:FkbM family methyltransferase
MTSRIVGFAQTVTRVVPKRLRRRMRRAMFEWLDLAWTLPSGATIRILSYADWIVYNEIFVANVYDDAIDAALRRTPPDRTLRVLDLGANCGLFTARVVDRLHRDNPDRRLHVTAVEGNPQLAARTARLCETLTTDRRTFSVVHGLAGRRDGHAELHISDATVSDGIFPHPGTTGVAVEYVDLWPELESGVDLMKVDIEGSELRLLETYAAVLPRVDVAVIEYHAPLIDPELARRIMRTSGVDEHCVYDLGDYSLYWYERVRQPIASA